MRAQSKGKKSVSARKKQPVAKRTKTTKPSVLQFRPRTSSDDEFIVKLTEGQLSTVHQQAFGEPFPREQFLGYLQSGAPTFVVEKDSQKVGYYSYLVSQDGKMHISAMVIDPSYQKDGLGTKVMEHIEQDAAKLGANTLEVFVQTSNEKSLSFTKRLGFVQAFQVTPTTVCFQKRLSGAMPTQTPNQPTVAAQPVSGPYPFY